MLLMILKYCLITFKGCLMILKCFFNDLSSSLNNCWVAEKTTKGGGGGLRPPPPPFVVFLAPKILRTAA